jgi:hypothetical protein
VDAPRADRGKGLAGLGRRDERSIVGQVASYHSQGSQSGGGSERHAYLSNLNQGIGAWRHRVAPAQPRSHGHGQTASIGLLWPTRRSVTLYLRHGFARWGGHGAEALTIVWAGGAGRAGGGARSIFALPASWHRSVLFHR